MITPEQLAKAGDEHGEQTALFQWAALNFKHAPELRMMFAIPNGGERNKIVASRLVAEGVRTGVPDVFLAVPRAGYCGLFIEMKRPAERLKRAPMHKWDTGGVKDMQIDWLDRLTAQFYKCVVCYTWLEASHEIKLYLTGTGYENGERRY